MKIALINPVRANISGGYRVYLNQILCRAENDSRVEAILFVSIPKICSQFSHYTKVSTCHIGFNYHCFPENKSIIQNLQNFAPDILYSPVEKTLPAMPGIPRVVMVQNMEPLVPSMAKNSLMLNIRLYILQRLAINAVRHSDHIIALSNFVRQHLSQDLGIPEQKITNIPHGVEVNLGQTAAIPAGLHTGQRFIFTAGIISPARGLEDIISAFIKLKKDNRYDNVKLCIAGEIQRYSSRYFKGLMKLAIQAGLEDQILWTGFLSQAEMKWCYCNCDVFVMTSRVESFGIIALEAMAFGSRVISTDSPCLPEVFQDYADYYEPGDNAELASLITNILESTTTKNSVNTKHKQSTRLNESINSRFNWDKTYNDTIKLLLRLTNNPTPEN